MKIRNTILIIDSIDAGSLVTHYTTVGISYYSPNDN